MFRCVSTLRFHVCACWSRVYGSGEAREVDTGGGVYVRWVTGLRTEWYIASRTEGPRYPTGIERESLHLAPLEAHPATSGSILWYICTSGTICACIHVCNVVVRERSKPRCATLELLEYRRRSAPHPAVQSWSSVLPTASTVLNLFDYRIDFLK